MTEKRFIEAKNVKQGMRLDIDSSTPNVECNDLECGGMCLIWTEFEFGVVADVTQETESCTLIEFENSNCFGFPSDQKLVLAASE